MSMSLPMSTDLPCPVCGFETFEENYGSYSICVVCDWEDDGVQLANPCSKGGANGKSLSDAQEIALKKYPISVDICHGVKRGTSWRPLSAEEKKKYFSETAEEPWPNKAVLYEYEAYWNT
ncbi:CPCC family cysteine-rich protein [Neptuniibacter sp. QD34_54]|uniref:CPCC family cysteine-rich protein n=1 Tax=Neptuniibacter sp. QD34_54 TaxID=3398208 RepID=UPI0039F5FF7A